MKKIIATFFLLICGLTLLLATVDLEPYLAPRSPQPQATPTNQPKDNTKDVNIATTVSEDMPRSTTFSESKHEPDISAEKLQPLETPSPLVEMTSDVQAIQQIDDSIEINNQAAVTGLDIIILEEGEYPFSILLETFNEEASARQAIPRFHKWGISSYWVKVDLGNNRIKYRLFTGVFPTVTEAQHYLDHHNLDNKPIKPALYSALVGVYPDKAQLGAAYRKTDSAGVVPYILGTETGPYFLYVGAFYTYAGATAQCLDLTTAGLNCRPVKRSTLREKQ